MQGLEELHYYTIKPSIIYVIMMLALEGLNLKLVVLLSLANDNKKQTINFYKAFTVRTTVVPPLTDTPNSGHNNIISYNGQGRLKLP